MAELDPRIQAILDFLEPPQAGQRGRISSQFGSAAGRPPGSSIPHGGLDVNRGRGVLPHGDVGSPVYGRVVGIDRAKGLNRITIQEFLPGTETPTGYTVEILHTETQSVAPDDRVRPGQVIGSQGDVGAGKGNFHAHIQIFRGQGSPRQNPLLHLFQYHFPGQPVPPLPQLSPAEVPARQSNGEPIQSPNPQGPGTTVPLQQLSPGMPIPDLQGPSSIGGPNGPTPLVAPRGPVGPGQIPAPTVPSLNFAPPSPPASFGPFTRPDNSGSSGNESTEPQPLNLPTLPGWLTPSFPFLIPADHPFGLSPIPGGEPAINPDVALQLPAPSQSGSGNAPGVPLRRISSAYPGMTLPDADQPAPPQPGRPLGIFTGKPMPSWPVPPPLGGLLNNSNASGNGDLVDFLMGLLPRNPPQPEPPQQTADSIPERRLGRRTYSISPASVFDTGAPAVPLAPSADANYSGGLLGMLAAPAGSDPNQPAPPDDEQEQADLQALEDSFTRTGSINDAWALYKARLASRR
jgi:murein DD-endopeptidase MepM/ murein hydrolase activator NlpD